MNSNFKPNSCKFEAGVERVKTAIKASKQNLSGKILTSKDNNITSLLNSLKVQNIPDNFSKWQLPFIFDRAQIYVSVGSPGADVPEHSHDEGSGLRYIVSGSISYNGKSLQQGDWMYIPKGVKYSFKVGDLGATMFYCYECCCA